MALASSTAAETLVRSWALLALVVCTSRAQLDALVYETFTSSGAWSVDDWEAVGANEPTVFYNVDAYTVRRTPNDEFEIDPSANSTNINSEAVALRLRTTPTQLADAVAAWRYRITFDVRPSTMNDPYYYNIAGANYGVQLHSSGASDAYHGIVTAFAMGIATDAATGQYDSDFPYIYSFEADSSFRCSFFECTPAFFCDDSCAYAANTSAPHIEYANVTERQWLTARVDVEPLDAQRASVHWHVVDERATVRIDERLVVNRTYADAYANGTVGLFVQMGRALYRNFRVYAEPTSAPSAEPTPAPSTLTASAEPTPVPRNELTPAPPTQIDDGGTTTTTASQSSTTLSATPSSTMTAAPELGIDVRKTNEDADDTPIFLVISFVIVSSTFVVFCTLYARQRWVALERANESSSSQELVPERLRYTPPPPQSSTTKSTDSQYELVSFHGNALPVVENRYNDATMDIGRRFDAAYQSASAVRRGHVYDHMVIDDSVAGGASAPSVDVEVLDDDDDEDIERSESTVISAPRRAAPLAAYGDTTLDSDAPSLHYDRVDVPLE